MIFSEPNYVKMRKKKSEPTVAIVDSQSVKTLHARDQNGYDGGKKLKGRKRHIAVDTLGLVLAVVVHAGSIQDRVGARALLIKLFGAFPRIIKIFADGGYLGKIVKWALFMFGWIITIVKKSDSGFKVLPKRWVVERTFGWWCFYRRLAKDYEQKAKYAEVMIQIVMIKLMLNRLTIT